MDDREEAHCDCSIVGILYHLQDLITITKRSYLYLYSCAHSMTYPNHFIPGVSDIFSVIWKSFGNDGTGLNHIISIF